MLSAKSGVALFSSNPGVPVVSVVPCVPQVQVTCSRCHHGVALFAPGPGVIMVLPCLPPGPGVIMVSSWCHHGVALFAPGPGDVFLPADGRTHVLQQNGSVLSVDNPTAHAEALRVKVKRKLLAVRLGP